MLETNPLKVFFSVCDRIRTSLENRNQWYGIATLDRWPAVFGAGFLLAVAGSGSLSPGPWYSSLTFYPLLFYLGYMLTSIFWRPVPFFGETPGKLNPGKIVGPILAFGDFDIFHDLPIDPENAIKQKRNRARFYWCKGTLESAASDLVLKVQIISIVHTSRSWGIIRRTVEIPVDPSSVRAGSATLLWKNVQAFQIESGDLRMVIALR